jgi:hypothetical protein
MEMPANNVFPRWQLTEQALTAVSFPPPDSGVKCLYYDQPEAIPLILNKKLALPFFHSREKGIPSGLS